MMRACRPIFAVLFFAAALASAQYFGGGGGQARVTFVLCNNEPCATGTNLTNRFIVTKTGSIKKCYITAKSAPTGASLIIDINKNGTTIFPASPKLVLAAGQTGPQTTTTFASASVTENDLLTVDIDQVGSLSAGQDVTAVCTF